jgi:hypothetical protein
MDSATKQFTVFLKDTAAEGLLMDLASSLFLKSIHNTQKF